MATFRDVPDVLYDAIKAKRYSRVSVELQRGVTLSGKKYPMVLTAVGLLGADIPAINTLADIQTYMSSDDMDGDHLVYTDFEKEIDMDELQKLTQRLDGLEKDMKAEKAANVELTTQVQTLTQERDALLTEKKTSEEETAKANFTSRLEELVQGKAMTPAQRDSMLDMYTTENADLLLKQVAVFTEGKHIGMKEGEQGQGTEQNEDSEKSADVRLTNMARTRANEEKIDFSAAMEIVLSENPDLAREYATMFDGGA